MERVRNVTIAEAEAEADDNDDGLKYIKMMSQRERKPSEVGMWEVEKGWTLTVE